MKEGLILKTAKILKSLSNSSNSNIKENLSQINMLSRRQLTEDEVYIFSMILCDNEIDRDFESFSDESLETLKSLFIGKTGIFDHVPTGANQTSRIFFTDVITDNSKYTSNGKPYKYLLAKAYMVRSEKNKDLILEIDAGIKKEISIGCAIKSKICSICGADHKVSPCVHIPGQNYVKNGRDTLCFLSLEDPLDAYEWSFVAVPAQVNAGVIKNFNTLSSSPYHVISSSDISEIKKSFSALSHNKTNCIISCETIKSLNKFFSDAQKNSETLKDFENDLKSQIYKMMSIAQPFLTQNSIHSIIDNLSYLELKELKNNLNNELDTKAASPQLIPLSSDKIDFTQDNNKMFKI